MFGNDTIREANEPINIPAAEEVLIQLEDK
jgi:hypothetical protein